MESDNQKQNTGQRLVSGLVVSAKMKDTVVVAIETYVKHPKYGKYMRRTKRFKAHDAGNTCVEGDLVVIKETRPMSKDKHFILVEKLKSAVKPIIEETEVEAK